MQVSRAHALRSPPPRRNLAKHPSDLSAGDGWGLGRMTVSCAPCWPHQEGAVGTSDGGSPRLTGACPALLILVEA